MKQRITFALLMGVITTGLISFTLVATNVGFSPAFMPTWLRSWLMAYLIVIPVILIIAPRVQAFVDRLYREKKIGQ